MMSNALNHVKEILSGLMSSDTLIYMDEISLCKHKKDHVLNAHFPTLTILYYDVFCHYMALYCMHDKVCYCDYFTLHCRD